MSATQGPWKWDRIEEDVDPPRIEGLSGPDGIHLLTATYSDSEVECVSLDDARLIAAAPDLLDALRGALAGHLQTYGEEGDCNTCREARAAIAKATGEETA